MGGGGGGVQYTTLTHMKGSTSFNATPNTCITFRAHSHMAVAHFSCIIVNAATDCYSAGQALVLNAGVQYTMHTKGSISFSSTPNTYITFGARSHMAITPFSCIIVNTATDCYSHGQSFQYASTPCFNKEKVNVLKVKDSICLSLGLSTSEKVDNSGLANKWRWE